jgi:hypothetical protein
MYGGTVHAEGQDANVFDNSNMVQATGTTFTAGSKSRVDEREPPEKGECMNNIAPSWLMAFPASGNGPRIFRNLRDSEFKNITANAESDSEIFKDAENVDIHDSKLTVNGRPYDQPPIEVETGILTPNLSA